MRYVLALALMLGLTSMVEAGYEWRNYDSDPNRLYLFQDGTQIGGYDIPSGTYRSYSARRETWGTACQPPFAVPMESQRNFGVNYRPPERDRITFQGNPISMDQAALAMENGIPADSQYLRLTVIGTPAQQEQVLTDLRTSPQFQGLREHLLARGYSPDNWAVQGVGFVTSGTPTIYVQSPDGKVLHRQDNYTGAAALATALRRLDPSYNPANDPDQRTGLGKLDLLGLLNLPPFVYILGAGVALLLTTPILPPLKVVTL